jgi:hypothetical protein
MKKLILAATLATLATAPVANAQEGTTFGLSTTTVTVGVLGGLLLLSVILDDSSTTTSSSGP